MDNINESLEGQIFLQIKEIITGIIGEEEAGIIGIERNSAFLQDLLIDSIRFVPLAGEIAALYGDRIDFGDWFTKKTLQQMAVMTVGELSSFIAESLSSAKTEVYGYSIF